MSIKVFYLAGVFALASTLFACNNSNTPSVGTGDFSGFELTAVEGTELSRAVLNENGVKMEEGFVANGMKQGTWMTFFGDGRIKTLGSYVNDNLDGVHLEFDQRGQIVKRSFHADGQLHGESSTYKFGRPQEIIPYQSGTVSGTVRRFYVNGKIMEEIQFKNGKQDGYYHHYNEQEQMDLKYEYKNGEKVSGGMVDVNSEN